MCNHPEPRVQIQARLEGLGAEGRAVGPCGIHMKLEHTQPALDPPQPGLYYTTCYLPPLKIITSPRFQVCLDLGTSLIVLGNCLLCLLRMLV